ncbi:glycosyltransferase [Occultella gossypii]|uniref:Glycosyltransferase n=1 Tax=Occultella gossypii TaxID=2800820 RepID=A0ABS7S950_9MICO|nr:glycosyltransferase [Occultella gossypii]MBZ2196453.1 glycosyltransferase [Occultella gossypii]
MANHLVSTGWDVTVVTATRDFFEDVTGSMDDDLLKHVDPRVVVERVRLPSDHLVTDIRRMSWRRAHLPKVVGAWARARERALFPEKYSAWIPGVVRRAFRVNRRRPIDVVLATGNPWSAFEAGRIIKRLTSARLVLDYRDSWTLNQFAERDAYGPDHRARAAEGRVMAAADLIVFVNEPMRGWHADRYPGAANRMTILENGYDPGLLGAVPFRPPSDEPLRFGSIGTITEHWPHEAWQGWDLVRTEPELAGAVLHLYGHLGFTPSAAPAIRAMLPGPQSHVVWEGPVPKADLTGVYTSLDVLVMMIPSSRYVTAGKTYEYMATGRPIVAIHSPQTAAAIPMRGYPLAFPCTDLSPASVASALLAAARRARTLTLDDHEAAIVHAEQYRRDVLLEPFETRVRGLIR